MFCLYNLIFMYKVIKMLLTEAGYVYFTHCNLFILNHNNQIKLKNESLNISKLMESKPTIKWALCTCRNTSLFIKDI